MIQRLSFFSIITLLLCCDILLAQQTSQIKNKKEPYILDTEICTIYSPNASLAREKKREMEYSARLFEDLLGVKPVKGEVHLTLKQPKVTGKSMMLAAGRDFGMTYKRDRWKLDWYKARSNKSKIAPAYALTHEAAHMQFIYYCFKERLTKRGVKNDWLMEGFATFHEPELFKKWRRKLFKVDSAIPLDKLFTMIHPAMTQSTLQTRSNFYLQSMSLLEYWVEKTGRPFVRYMIARHCQRWRMEEILVSWNKDLPDIKLAAKGSKEKFDCILADGLKIPIRPNEKLNKVKENIKKLEWDWKIWVKLKYPKYQYRYALASIKE